MDKKEQFIKMLWDVAYCTYENKATIGNEDFLMIAVEAEKLFAIQVVINQACDKCKRSLSPKIKEGECIICNTPL